MSEDEERLVIEVLESEIPELREEIMQTDDHNYRDALKERERRIAALLAKLQEKN
jgi:hypothetical protein